VVTEGWEATELSAAVIVTVSAVVEAVIMAGVLAVAMFGYYTNRLVRVAARDADTVPWRNRHRHRIGRLGQPDRSRIGSLVAVTLTRSPLDRRLLGG
jgi:hypothetical protein